MENREYRETVKKILVQKFVFFKSPDQKDVKKQFRRSLCGVILTLLSVIVSAFFNKDNAWSITITCLVSLATMSFGLILLIKSIKEPYRKSIVDTYTKVSKAYENGLLKKAIDACLVAADKASIVTNPTSKNPEEDMDKKKFIYFLQEITEADRLNPLELKIDDNAFDNIYDVKGTLSITEAPLFAWKNPEYNWFLLSHYVATLLKRIEKVKGSKLTRKKTPLLIKIKNREIAVGKPFGKFLKEGREILDNISRGEYQYDNSVRFFLLTKEEIKKSQAMFEQLVAGHDLFGIHLFVIDKEQVFANTNSQLNKSFNDLHSIDGINNNVFDIMVYKDNLDVIEYKIGEKGKLTNKGISEETKNQIDRFITDLVKEVKNNKKALLYPCNTTPYKFNIDGVCTNDNRSFLDISC